jgi:hypothetical protein
MQGVLGVFHEIDSAVHAVEAIQHDKLGKITIYTPTPRHEFEPFLSSPPSNVRRFTLAFGLAGVTFGYWIAVWIAGYWPLVVGGKAIVTYVPFTVFGFEVMVLIGGLATVFSMFALARIPRLTTTVGYDPRFSAGHYGVWVTTAPERMGAVEDVMRTNGAEEVRRER